MTFIKEGYGSQLTLSANHVQIHVKNTEDGLGGPFSKTS